MYDELVKRLKSEGDFPYNDNRNLLREAADAIEGLQKALLLMVLQYCTTDDGLLFHSFMSAGENAFAVLGLENGQQAEPLWEEVE